MSSVEYFDYTGYPEYEQLFPPFDHYVSVIDLIFNTGPRATQYMRRHLMMSALNRRDTVPVGATPGGIPRPRQQGCRGGERRLRSDSGQRRVAGRIA